MERDKWVEGGWKENVVMVALMGYGFMGRMRREREQEYDESGKVVVANNGGGRWSVVQLRGVKGIKEPD